MDSQSIGKYNFFITAVLLLLVTALIIATSGYAWQQSDKKQGIGQDNSRRDTMPSPSQINSEGDPFTWRPYSNERYGFAFKYPKGWKVQELSSEYPIILVGTSSPGGLHTNLGFAVYPVRAPWQSVFDRGDNAQIRTGEFAGKKARIFSCVRQKCPPDFVYRQAIRITDLPRNWAASNEIDFYRGSEDTIATVESILTTFRFIQ